MESILAIICIIIFILFLNFSLLKKKNPEELNPEQQKIIEINQSINDTVNVKFNKIKKRTATNLSLQFITSGIWRHQSNENIIYIFRKNGEILITKNGLVKRGKYEYIIDNNSIIITEDDITRMFYVVNLKNDVLILQDIGNNEILQFVNETKVKDRFISQMNIDNRYELEN